jgi:hypothetical protein
VPEFVKGLDPKIYRERERLLQVPFRQQIVDLKKSIAAGNFEDGLVIADAAAKQVTVNDAHRAETLARYYRTLNAYDKSIEMYEFALRKAKQENTREKIAKIIEELKVEAKASN